MANGWSGTSSRFTLLVNVPIGEAVAPDKNKRNVELFTAEDFIAAITQPIPPKNYQMVRYPG